MMWHIIIGTADVSLKELKISALNRVLLENLLVSYFANFPLLLYEGWNFNSGNYLFTTDTK